MGRPASTKTCPTCGLPGLKRNGQRSGRIRWRCTKCGASSSRSRPDATELAQFTQFLGWVVGKHSQREVDATATGRTARRRFAWCWNVPTPKPGAGGVIFDQVFIDGVFLAYGWCLLIARSTQARVIDWQWCHQENSDAYKALLSRIPPPRLVTTDGGGGALKAIKETWPDVKVQRCLVHVHRNNLRDLTSRPKTPPGRTLLALSKALLKVKTPGQAAAWAANLGAFHTEYGNWIKARTYARDNPEEAKKRGKNPSGWWYTHQRDRRVYQRLDRLFKNGHLFAYLTTTPGTVMERTTNPVESINNQVKRLLRHHPGLSEDHMNVATEWLLHSYTDNPHTPAQILKNWNASGSPTRRIIPKKPRKQAPSGPKQYDTNPTSEEGLHPRKGWAGQSH